MSVYHAWLACRTCLWAEFEKEGRVIMDIFCHAHEEPDKPGECLRIENHEYWCPLWQCAKCLDGRRGKDHTNCWLEKTDG